MTLHELINKLCLFEEHLMDCEVAIGERTTNGQPAGWAIGDVKIESIKLNVNGSPQTKKFIMIYKG